ncbi:hypothetical protein HJC23_006116 [Cyclotella cryptica]|uniref:Transmembrane protein 65 n=1 Tax=Cyclotella cryptica TaxID=29204 RepID=A0ABD3QL09_9STRA|eukprot:CCRYP_004588-RA/>CCRYP_004588-RA protein AED:0.05 eAED:0.05 QI:286/1/1/1/1/1/3/388/223
MAMMMRVSVIQSHVGTASRSLRSLSSSSRDEKWPLTHPCRRSLRNLQEHLRRDELLVTAPSKMSPTSSSVEVAEPTQRELRIIALHSSIPFVGFGIMDNGILILAGEAIDTTVGITLGISTMCAAAIGNIISDICGVAFGTIIEDTIARFSQSIEKMSGGKVKLPPFPKLSHEQRNLRSVRLSNQLGCAIGLTIGCIIGMFPLLFFDDEKKANDSVKECDVTK